MLEGEEEAGVWTERTREKVEETEMRVRRDRQCGSQRSAHKKLPELLIPFQFLVPTLYRVPTCFLPLDSF